MDRRKIKANRQMKINENKTKQDTRFLRGSSASTETTLLRCHCIDFFILRKRSAKKKRIQCRKQIGDPQTFSAARLARAEKAVYWGSLFVILPDGRTKVVLPHNSKNWRTKWRTTQLFHFVSPQRFFFHSVRILQSRVQLRYTRAMLTLAAPNI